MFYRPGAGHGLPHDPFTALVAPRPIGWISTVDPDGRFNLSPYSFFNAFAYRPPTVGFSGTARKDSVLNAEETGCFVVNIATEHLKTEVNASSVAVPRGVDEFTLTGLTPEPARLVKAPRVKEARAALECRTSAVVPIVGADGGDPGAYLVLGEVVGVHIDDGVLRDGLVDVALLRPLARLGYLDFTVVDSVFAMERPLPPA